MGEGKKVKVLVIDDNKEWTELLCSALNEQYISLGALDGAQGMEIAARESPDLILCDIMLPKMTGAELLRSFQSHPVLHKTQVVMMTANRLDAATQGLFKSHPNVRGFLQKPCPLTDVLKTVQYVLQTPNVRMTKPQQASPGTPPPVPVPPPVPEAVPTAIPRQTPLPRPGVKSYKILIVDDDVNCFQFLNLVIHRDDLIFRATDGMQALEHLKNVKPDLIITDLMMPGMSGIEVMRNLQKQKECAKIPTIFLTAAHIDDRNREMLTKEFPNLVTILTKPCDVKDIRAVLEKLLPRDLAK
ncbi:MAG: response regulator [Elusimicrobia bacterium]|nr:response regulator [Elusimicrobiota bacterium]